MSLIKFNLTEEHIKLVRQLQVNMGPNNENIVAPRIDSDEPFGSEEIFEDMFLILYGKPAEEELNVNPWDEIKKPWNEEQLEHMKKLLSELAFALDIILYTGNFQAGEYKTKSYQRDWKKVETWVPQPLNK